MPEWPQIGLRSRLSLVSLFLVFLAWIASLQVVLFVAVHAKWRAAETADAVAPMHRATFVLFGDSITQHSFDEGGWGARMASNYQRKADVVLRGYSGYNIAWAQFLLKGVFPKDAAVKPALVTVFFGANDAALAGGVNERQHVPLTKYAELLRSTVRHVANSGAGAMVLITPPPIDEAARIVSRKEKWGVNERSEEPDRLNEVTGKYAAACRAVAAEAGLPCLDIWTEFQKDPEWRAYLSDGLHLTVHGNAALYRLLQQLIDAELPQLRFDVLPLDFPLHDNLTADDPGSSFVDTVQTVVQDLP